MSGKRPGGLPQPRSERELCHLIARIDVQQPGSDVVLLQGNGRTKTMTSPQGFT
jgi:hypothetical protein